VYTFSSALQLELTAIAIIIVRKHIVIATEARQYLKLFKECLKKHFSEEIGSGNRARMNHKYQIFELDRRELNTLNKSNMELVIASLRL
jgi:hypothetical protein